ncbi:MAG TPA: glycosyltransferase [Aquaticitalea sp.]|nr:glycosyltransferase [Aquaticitalea sp.]
MKNELKLYYFTDSYPFSADITWKSKEIYEASQVFEEVIIVPFTFKTENHLMFPNNVRIEAPTLRNTLFAKPKYLKHLISLSQPQKWLKELFRAFPKGKQAILDWYLATIYSDIIVKRPVFKELKKNRKHQEKCVLFFQWTMNNALMVPSLYKWGYRNIVCRMHGYDLYEFRHHQYAPYKPSILKKASACTFISKHGLDYIQKRYPFVKEKCHLHYLGAKAMKTNIVDPDNTFHVISVSRVVPLKRLELIVDALKMVNFPIKWTHIGDGYAFDAVKKKADIVQNANQNCEIEFLGWLPPQAIEDYYSNNGIGALALVSETEGLPVVIMEAFSASVPVIATDVGGVSELVNTDNGVLLAPNPSPEDVAKAIGFLAKEDKESRSKRREQARVSYAKDFDLLNNSKAFIDFLYQKAHSGQRRNA